MGACFSHEHGASPSQETAKVISVNGELREYSVPVTVVQVLQTETHSSLSSPSAFSFFVCNSDCLCYEEFIPALHSDEELMPNQIYFVLPNSKLRNRLAASDMAALAVKASLALQKSTKRGGHRRRSKTQISPVLEVARFDQRGGLGASERHADVLAYGAEEFTVKKGLGIKTTVTTTVRGPSSISRTGSVRKLQRSLSSSRRMKLAVRSFRMRLSTIHEGSAI